MISGGVIERGALGDVYGALRDQSPLLAAIVLIVVVFSLAAIAERILRRAIGRAWRRHSERALHAVDVTELQHSKRQQTIGTLVQSLARYAVFGVAAIIVVTVLAPRSASAVFGASLLVVLVGFGMQRLLNDMLAGMLLLFEGHFSVGDVIKVEPSGALGVVEQFSLRSTTLRTLGGDRSVIMNGSLVAFTRYSFGQREYRLSLLVCGDDGVAGVRTVLERESQSSTSWWVVAPKIAAQEPVGDLKRGAAMRVEIRAVVAPGFEELATESLPARLASQLGDDLVGDVRVVNAHGATFEAYRARLLLRDSDG